MDPFEQRDGHRSNLLAMKKALLGGMIRDIRAEHARSLAEFPPPQSGRTFDSQMDEPRLGLIEPAPVFKKQSKLGMNRRDLLRAGVFAAVAIPLSRLSAQTVPAPLKPGHFKWRPERAPSDPVVLIVSISEQLAYVYRNGIRIGVSTCSTGAPGHRTPTGVFSILQKNADHYSNLYNNAPMPYMQSDLARHRPPRWRFAGLQDMQPRKPHPGLLAPAILNDAARQHRASCCCGSTTVHSLMANRVYKTQFDMLFQNGEALPNSVKRSLASAITALAAGRIGTVER